MDSNVLSANGVMRGDEPDATAPGDQHAWDVGRQLAANNEAAIAFINAKLEHATTSKRFADGLRSHTRAASEEKRPASTRREDPKASFFRDRRSTGLREELLQSGWMIRHLQGALELERRSHKGAIARAWEFEEAQRARFLEFHGRELKRMRDYHVRMMAIRNAEADRLREYFITSVGSAGANAYPVEVTTPSMAPMDPIYLAERASGGQAALVQPLTCVRVVGESRLPHGLDVLSLISSFLLSTDISVDFVVSRGALHVAAWLFANGKQPTARTAHVAVNTGSLSMVQLVFHHFATPLGNDVFTDLPIGGHTEISEWLMREYPAHMAHEFTRLATSQKQLPHNQWTWYADRLQRQWQWEDAIEEECWQRKRARLRLEQ